MSPFRDLSIRAKLTTLITTVAVVVLLVTGVTLFLYERAHGRERLSVDLGILARVVGANSAAALDFDDRGAAREILAGLRADRSIELAVLYDGAGEMFAIHHREDLPETIAATPPQADGVHFAADHVDLVETIVSDGMPLGRLWLRSDLDVLERRLVQYSWILGAILLVASLLALVLSARLQRPISRPIAALAALAHRVADERDYSIRAERSAGGELGTLIDGVNDMLAEIEARDRALADANRDLERRVEDRTRALRSEIEWRKRTEEDLEHARDAALESARIKAEFLANMSHEIRTPMNAVLGMTSLLLETDLSPEQHEFAETAWSSGETLLNLLNDILDFSKIESGMMQLQSIDYDVHAVVGSVTDLLAQRAASRGLELMATIDPDVPRLLRGDPSRIRQVLINLVGNAIKFTERGDVVLSVERLADGGERPRLRFVVRDSGIGISEVDQTRLFQSFTQVDGSTARRYGGTGLGLAISKSLVSLMNGTIGVRSAPGKGSEFWFELDLEPAAAEPPPSPEDVTSLAGLRVLIVDDNPTNREILHRQLSKRGVRAERAAGGVEALSMLRQSATSDPFAIALLDVGMPEMDGLALARRIRQEPEIRDTRLVLLTSVGRRHVAEDPATGVAAQLTKPVKQTELVACLVSLVEGRPWPGSLGREKAFPARARVATPRGARILVVEDHPVNQRLVCLMLQKLGYDPVVARDGVDALALLDRQSFDLIFMDVQMPRLDGYQTTAEIRRRATPDSRTPIVAMTAHALGGEREKCLAAGMDDYLSKPVKIDALESTIRRWLPVEAAGTGSGESDGLDPSILRSLGEGVAAGEPDPALEVIDLYLRDASERLEQIEAHVRDGRVEDLRAAVHSLKGSSAQIGAHGLAAVCRSTEEAIDRQPPSSLEPWLANLRSELGRLRDRLEQELRRLGRGR